MHAYQTSQHVATQLRSKLYCGLGMILILTAVMSGLPSSQHTHDLTELCSRYDETLTRKARSGCVETSEGRLEYRRYLTMCSEEQLGQEMYQGHQLLL